MESVTVMPPPSMYATTCSVSGFMYGVMIATFLAPSTPSASMSAPALVTTGAAWPLSIVRLLSRSCDTQWYPAPRVMIATRHA